MSQGAAPQSVNYANTLPLAITASQNRRSFYPQNGQAFTDTGSNIIRIDVQADGLLDAQQSYLEFTFTGKSDGAGALGSGPRSIDQGHAWIKRLTIESAGVILEDINNYNRLVAGILQPVQGSAAYCGEMGLSQFANSQMGTSAANEPPSDGFQNALPDVANNPQDINNGSNILAANGSFTGQYHLVCGLLNLDKYIPLVLMGQGITIQIELENGANIGVVTNTGLNKYEISNVKYVSHIVEMGRDFYDMLRNLQAQSGGSLMLGGSTFRHFTHAMAAGAVGSSESINITARVRSLENLLWVGNLTANLNDDTVYTLSTGTNMGLSDGTATGSYNVFIGAERYPSNKVSVNAISNKGEAYQELRKCFGALGSINHGGLLNPSTYLANVDGNISEDTPGYAPLGISFRSFRHELEDGIDTSSRALPIRLDLQGTHADGATTLDIYAQATILFYVNMDGSVTSSV